MSVLLTYKDITQIANGTFHLMGLKNYIYRLYTRASRLGYLICIIRGLLYCIYILYNTEAHLYTCIDTDRKHIVSKGIIEIK